MTRTSVLSAALFAACGLAFATMSDAARAQCTTCPTPTVAFSPVMVAPTQVVVAPRVGLFDRWRMRRWGVTAPVMVPTVAMAPVAQPWTVGFAPVAQPMTVGFAPTAQPMTVGFAPAATPFVTSFAPLQRPVAMTTFMPVTTMPVATAVLSPVVSAPACSACSTTVAFAAAPCDACSTCSTGVTQAAFAEQSFVQPSAGVVQSAEPGCSTCASASGGVQYSDATGGYSTQGTGTGGGPATPPPALDPVPAPMDSGYPPIDPGPAAETTFDAPSLLGPANDRTAHGPTVDVRTAVYRRPVGASSVSTSATRPTSTTAVDSSAWSTGSGQ